MFRFGEFGVTFLEMFDVVHVTFFEFRIFSLPQKEVDVCRLKKRRRPTWGDAAVVVVVVDGVEDGFDAEVGEGFRRKSEIPVVVYFLAHPSKQ